MKRSFLFQFFGIILLLSLFLGLTGFHPVSAASSQIELTLADLGMPSPQILTGPISEYSLRFNLPANWKAEGTVKLDLDLTAFFSSLVVSESTDTITGLVGGNISVYLNDTLVGSNTLSQAGQQFIPMEFDAGLLQSVTRDSINVIRIRWDGSNSCSMNLLSSITISPTSKISVGYQDNPKKMTLNDFPVPFLIENSINPVPLKIFLPEKPTAGELRAAMILSAGVGQISRGKVSIEIFPLADYHPSATTHQNVILVANSDTLKTLSLASLGVVLSSNPAAGEGLLDLFTPQGGYGLLVSGDEAGIVKAAQAASADQVVAAGDGLNMIVSGVNPIVAATGVEDMTLQDLGSGELVFAQPSQLEKSVDFFVPAGNQVRADAYFNLIISHSQQLDYLSSGLQVKVNDFPAVSLRLNDNTSNQALFTLILPANLIHAGRNSIEFVANLNTRDLCTAATESVAWLRVSSSSLLHLPLESAVGGSALAKSFGDFPNAFLAGTGLNDITVVISPANFGYIQAAAKLTKELGAALPDHTVFELKAIASDSPEAGQAAATSVILIGRPSDFPTLSDKSQFPSLVFNADNSLSEQSTLELVSKPEAGADVGYLAIRGFDALSNRVVMAVLGNDTAGVSFAVDAINNRRMADNNFVIVVADNVQDGWLDTGIATGKVVSSTTEITPTVPGLDPVQVFRINMLKWVVPVLVILLAVMLLFIYMEIRQSIRKNQ